MTGIKTSSQKTIRIDDRILNKLDTLSKVTNRSFNELVELSLKNYLVDNAIYYLELDLVARIAYTTDAFKYEKAGLYFFYKEHNFLIFSINPRQEPEYGNLSVRKASESYKKLELDKTVATIEGNSKYKLVNWFVLPQLENSESLNSEPQNIAYLNILSSYFSKLDLNYFEMQEWIRSEFDFT